MKFLSDFYSIDCNHDDVLKICMVNFVSAESSRPEWRKECALPPNSFPLLMLELSQDQVFVVGTFMTGFQLWNSTDDNRQVHETQFAILRKNCLGLCVIIFTRDATCNRPPKLSKLSLFPHAQIPLVNAPQLMLFFTHKLISNILRRLFAGARHLGYRRESATSRPRRTSQIPACSAPDTSTPLQGRTEDGENC